MEMPRSGFAGAVTCIPSACNRSTTSFQLEPSAKAPCTRTTVGRDSSCGFVLIVLPPRLSLSRPSSSSASLPRYRHEQAGVPDILDGEHADELSVLGDGQRPEATLLQDGKPLPQKVGLGRDCGDVRFHQVADTRVPLRGVGRGHDLLTRDHANELPLFVQDGEVFLVAVDDRVQNLTKGVRRRNGFGTGLGTHDVRDDQAARELPLPHHLSLSARPKEDEDADEGEQDVATEQAYEEEGSSEDLPDNRRDLCSPECSQAGRK